MSNQNQAQETKEETIEEKLKKYMGHNYVFSGKTYKPQSYNSSIPYVGGILEKLGINKDALFTGLISIDKQLKISGQLHVVEVIYPDITLKNVPVSYHTPFVNGLTITIPYNSDKKPKISHQEISGNILNVNDNICMAFTLAPLDQGLSRTAMAVALAKADVRFYLRQTNQLLHHFAGRYEHISTHAGTPPFNTTMTMPNEYVLNNGDDRVYVNLDKESITDKLMAKAAFGIGGIFQR